MSLKKFGIYTLVIIAILISTFITLACVKVDNGLKIADPDKIIVYAKTSVGVEYSKSSTPSKYNESKKLYDNSTKLSIFDYMLNKKSLKELPGQNISEDYETWKESNKTYFYCIELIFNQKQSVVVSIDGNTKVIEFYALIMKVEKSSNGKNVDMYFSTTEGDYKSYSSSPINVMAKQNKLYNFIDKLASKE